ncbi:MAG: AAA family ATPase [Spirulina sp.]
MKPEICAVENIARLADGFDFLRTSEDRLMFVYGWSGSGKTQALEDLAGRENCYFWRALPFLSKFQVVSALLEICGSTSAGIRSYGQGFDALTKRLINSDRALLIDECGYLSKHIEILRSLGDETKIPILIAGLPSFYNDLVRHPQVSDRINFVEFSPWTLTDAKLVVKTRCEVSIEDALIERVYEITNGLIEESAERSNARLLCRIFANIEFETQKANLTEMTLKEWGKRQFLPQFGKKPQLSKTRRRAA